MSVVSVVSVVSVISTVSCNMAQAQFSSYTLRG